jgi:tetratricopeptide (TPR) repeat protein
LEGDAMKKIAISTAKSGVCRTTFFIFSVLINLYPQQKSSISLNKDFLVMRTEGISFLGSGMNEADAKTFAITDAKRNALDQAGTYLESHTTVLNYQLVKDEVIAFSAGLLKTKVLKEERTLINNMFAFKVNILSAINTKLLDERIKEIREDDGLRQQLEAEKERNKQLEDRIAELQVPGSIASKQTVKKVIDELSASDWYNKGVFSNNNNLKIGYYTKAIDLNPQFAYAYYNRGCAYSALGKHDVAIQNYTKVIELVPEFSVAYYTKEFISIVTSLHNTYAFRGKNF